MAINYDAFLEIFDNVWHNAQQLAFDCYVTKSLPFDN